MDSIAELIAFQVLMFSEKDTWILFTLLAAILHLGNLRFQGTVKTVSHGHPRRIANLPLSTGRHLTVRLVWRKFNEEEFNVEENPHEIN